MITMLISMNMSLTMIFMTMKHPLSMGAVLLLQTIIISLISGNLAQNFWFSYILFLIMVGGMLILFMYMTSIASNEKFKTNLKMIIIVPITIFMWMMIENPTNYISSNEMMESGKNIQFHMIINKFINMPLTAMFLFMMIYLLLALIATVKITKFKQGSIRQMN